MNVKWDLYRGIAEIVYFVNYTHINYKFNLIIFHVYQSELGGWSAGLACL